MFTNIIHIQKIWISYGYIKNFDVQVGATTNPNVSEEIRKLSNEEFLPFLKPYFKERTFTFHNYILGGPPDINLIRHSTYDINDGQTKSGNSEFIFFHSGRKKR